MPPPPLGLREWASEALGTLLLTLFVSLAAAEIRPARLDETLGGLVSVTWASTLFLTWVFQPYSLTCFNWSVALATIPAQAIVTAEATPKMLARLLFYLSAEISGALLHGGLVRAFLGKGGLIRAFPNVAILRFTRSERFGIEAFGSGVLAFAFAVLIVCSIWLRLRDEDTKLRLGEQITPRQSLGRGLVARTRAVLFAATVAVVLTASSSLSGGVYNAPRYLGLLAWSGRKWDDEATAYVAANLVGGLGAFVFVVVGLSVGDPWRDRDPPELEALSQGLAHEKKKERKEKKQEVFQYRRF